MDFVNGHTFGLVSATFHILLALFMASYLFNRQIDKAGNRAEGQDWKLVVFGVFYTQLAIGALDMILPWNAFFIGMLAYAVSGLPMAYGAQQRHRERQGRAEQALRE